MTAAAKKKRVPDGILNSKPKTGLKALQLATGEDAPVRTPKLVRAPAPAREERPEAVLFYITATQRTRFQDEAVKRARAGGGKINSSAVMRAFLDECLEGWLARQR